MSNQPEVNSEKASDLIEAAQEISQLESNPHGHCTSQRGEPLASPQPIKIAGHRRTDPNAKYDKTHRQNMIKRATLDKTGKDASTNDILDDETVKEIVKQANENPVTLGLIEEARNVVKENKETILKQFNDLVALYNIAQNKAFFFITAAEARLAIDHVKKCREGHIQDVQTQEEQDLFIYRFMNEFADIRALNENNDDTTPKVIEAMACDLEELCFGGASAKAYCVDRRGEVPESPIVTGSVEKLSTPNKPNYFGNLVPDSLEDRIEQLEKSKQKMIEEGVDVKEPEIKKMREFPEFMLYNWGQEINSDCKIISLGWLNQLLAFMEGQDLIVDVLLMNASNIAGVRCWGESVYDQYSKKEYTTRKVFGRVFGAEIYICNQLNDNQIIAGSLALKPHGVFVNARM